jgi:hypothetical protein
MLFELMMLANSLIVAGAIIIMIMDILDRRKALP